MTRVLVVDDSALVRKVFTARLSQYPDIEVVGSAVDPYVARDKILQLKPDVLTLDIEMPRMDGLTFLSKLMQFNPLPVIVVSSIAPKHSAAAIRALELGAVDVVPKPGSAQSVLEDFDVLARAVRTASIARVARRSASAAEPVALGLTGMKTTNALIALGASTGGTRAIEQLLRRLPADCPPVLITQHMPAGFTKPFAQRLDTLCAIRVKEATHGETLVPGTALIAPADQHLEVRRSGAVVKAFISQTERVNHHRPSVDVMFRSLAQHVGVNAMGALLTGMGSDGAQGLLSMRQAGAFTLAESEESCVVFGMPKQAIALGAAVQVLPLDSIAERLMRQLKAPNSGRSSMSSGRAPSTGR